LATAPFISGPEESIGRYDILLDRWSLESFQTTGRSFKFMMLHGARIQGENLEVHQSGRVVRRGLRLQGNCTWHFFSHNEWLVALVDDGGRKDLIKFDLATFEFLNGITIRVDDGFRMAPDGTTVGAEQINFGFRPVPRPHNSESPLALRLWSMCAFDLFQKLAVRLAEDKLTQMAVSTIADSHIDHLDGAYLKIQVGIEALCVSKLSTEKRILVKDKNLWLAWCQSREDEIKAMALNETLAKSLYGKVEGAFQSTATTKVPEYLSQRFSGIPETVNNELKNRHPAVHEYQMSAPISEGERDWILDVKHLCRLRFILTAVIAEACRYSGPLREPPELKGEDFGWWKSNASPLKRFQIGG
jgi:hypothetical protein